MPKGRELSLLALCGRNSNVSQGGREMIAQGKQHKFPMASVDGEFVSCSVPEGFARAPIGFNPRAQHLLVDPAGHAIHHAEELWGRETVSMPAPPDVPHRAISPLKKRRAPLPAPPAYVQLPAGSILNLSFAWIKDLKQSRRFDLRFCFVKVFVRSRVIKNQGKWSICRCSFQRVRYVDRVECSYKEVYSNSCRY